VGYLGNYPSAVQLDSWNHLSIKLVIFVKISIMVDTDIKEEIKGMLDNFDQKELKEILSFIKQKDGTRQTTPLKLAEFADKIIKQEHNLLKRLAE
jgi:hypothetical protein